MPTYSYGQSGNASSGSYTGPWNQGTQYIYSAVGYPTGNLNLAGTRVVSIDSVSLSGTFSSTGGYTPFHNSSGQAGVSWNSAYRLNYTRYIDNGLDLIDTSSGSDKTDGGIRGVTTYSTVPAKPGTPTATATSSSLIERQVTLSWAAPDNGGSLITGYNIYDSTNTIITSTDGTGTSATFSLAIEKLGTQMSFNVAARNLRGISERSSNSNAVQIEGNPLAPVLNSVSIGTVNTASVSLSWSAPSNDGDFDGGITGYSIFAAPVAGTRVLVATTTGTGTTLTITDDNSDPDLQDGVEYTFDVRARNAFSDANGTTSPASNTISQYVSGPPSAPPTPSAQNTVDNPTIPVNTIVVSWTAPSPGYPAVISEYIVYYRVASPEGPLATTTVNGATTTATLSGLIPGAVYSIYVTAKNSLTNGGEGPASPTISKQAIANGGWTDTTIYEEMRVGVLTLESVSGDTSGGLTYTYSSFFRENGCQNPSFESNTTGWSVLGSSTIARSVAQSYVGAASLQVSATALDGGTSLANIPSTPTTQYTASAWILGEAGKGIAIEIVAIGGASTTTREVSATGSWQRVSVFAVTPSDTTQVSIRVKNKFDGSHTFFVDAVLVEQSSELLDYFDGSTVSSGGITYSWLGTVNNSLSKADKVNNSLPPGIELNSFLGTGLIGGIPTTQGKYIFRIRAVPSSGTTPGDQSYKLYVRPGGKIFSAFGQQNISKIKRFDGELWIDVGITDVSEVPIGMKRWDGTQWILTTKPPV